MPGSRYNPFLKDPDDIKTFGINWAPDLLTGDTLDTSVWAVVAGTVMIDTDTSDTTHTLVTLSGGTLEEKCALRNRVVTTQGEQYDQTIYVRIKAR